MSLREAYSEKIRAALCRHPAAIRDFYDLDHAFQKTILDETDTDLLDLVRRKLAVPGNDLPDASVERHRELEMQLDAALRPVLRSSDFGTFELARAFEAVRQIAQQL